MRFRPLYLLTALGLTALAAQAVDKTTSTCLIQPYVSGPPSELGQYQLRLDYPPECRANLLFVRIRTRNGGLILPPIGYFRLSPGYPRELRYWIWPGAHVEQKTERGWQIRPIHNLPGGWY